MIRYIADISRQRVVFSGASLVQFFCLTDDLETAKKKEVSLRPDGLELPWHRGHMLARMLAHA